MTVFYYCLAQYIFCVSLKRLKNWEIRERKKSRDYSKETEREDERRREMVHLNALTNEIEL